MAVISFLTFIGSHFINFMGVIGRLSIFCAQATLACFHIPLRLKQILLQLYYIGYLSFPVIGLTAIFSGMVLALQSYTGFSRFSSEVAIPSVVALSITRELGPVLGGLMVAGRVGAAMAAEIGTMRVSEQIDALITLSTNPLRYLVAPRVIASVIALPILVLCADAIGIFGGYLVSTYHLDFNAGAYIDQTFKFLERQDVISGLIKAAVFGYIIGLMGFYQGYYSKGGAQGVGQATTRAVVLSSILILLSNYILTALLFSD
jgi:phospholipid/cholesterol/gamma-HCH transport system permease protein